tara:strand:- start:768 stop:1751 length:984 start_codon:yes stop_codon:yes gene_type:complete
MNFNDACDILELHKNFTIYELKKAYYKQALKHHPDKKIKNIINIGSKTKKKDNEYFHKILDSYKYLNNYLIIKSDINNNCKLHDNLNNEVNDNLNSELNYESILHNFIKTINKLCKSKIDISVLDISNLILNIIKNYKTISFETFKNVDNNILLKLVGYIQQYSDVFEIKKETINKIKEIVKQKLKVENSFFILNPTIDNLFNKDIYKFNYNNDTFYIPLWHDEIVYNINNNDIIIKCIPDLPEHIYIDDINNINISITLSIENIIDKEFIDINIGKKIVKLMINEVKIKKKQIIILKNKGIPIINEIDIYNIDKNSDIIINIYLTN